MRLFTYCLLCSCCLHTVGLYAQKDCRFRFDGRIYDEAGQPLAGALIRIIPTQQATNSSEDGFFYFSSLCEGKQVVEISFIGYKSLYDTLFITTDIHRNYRLYPEILGLQEILVESKPMFYESLITASLSEAEQWRQAGKTLSDLLEEIVGVQSLRTGVQVAQPMVHGFWGNRLALSVEDSPLASQRWGEEHAPEIDPLAYDDVEVVKGAQAVLFGGEAIGGAILMRHLPLSSVDSLQSRWMLTGQSNGRGAQLHQRTMGRLSERWAFRLYSTAEKSGDRHSPNYVLSNTGHEQLTAGVGLGYRYQNWDASLDYEYYGADIGILRAAHIGNLTGLANSIERRQPWYIAPFTYERRNPRQRITHHSLRLQSHLHGRQQDWQLTYSFQQNDRQEFDVRRGGRDHLPAIWMRLLQHHLRLSTDLHLLPRVESRLSAEALWQDNTNFTQITGIRPIVPDYRRMQYSLAVVSTLHLPKSEWNWGFRIDHNTIQAWAFDYQRQLHRPYFQGINTQASVGLHSHLSNKLSLTANASWSSRLPAINELFSQGLHHGSGWIEEGLLVDRNGFLPTASFRFEHTYRLVSEWKWQYQRHQILFIPHLSYINHYLNLEAADVRLTIRGAFPVFEYKQIDVLWIGADLQWVWQLSNRLLWLQTGSLLWAYDLSRQAGLNRIPPPTYQSRLRWRMGSWRALQNWSVEPQVQYFGLPLSQPVVIPPAQVQELEEVPVRQAWDFMPPPADYWLVHLRIEGEYKWRKRPIGIAFSIENVLNQAYRSYLNRWRYFTDDIGRNYRLSILYKI